MTNKGKKHRVGKIIAVVGGPRSGKSFLVGRLAEHFGAMPILEGEEQDFPKEIREDIKQNTRPLERCVWFRNKLVAEYLRACKMKDDGNDVIIDNFWISYQLYIDGIAKGFEAENIHALAKIDREILPWPDLTLYLSLSEKTIREFIRRGNRTFDQSEDFIKNQALPVHKLYTDFFSQKEIKKHVLTISRDHLDFTKEKDFSALIERIESFTSVSL